MFSGSLGEEASRGEEGRGEEGGVSLSGEGGGTYGVAGSNTRCDEAGYTECGEVGSARCGVAGLTISVIVSGALWKSTGLLIGYRVNKAEMDRSIVNSS